MSTPWPEHRAPKGGNHHQATVSRIPFLVFNIPDHVPVPLFSMFETLYLSMDANFKLKQKERGFTDPPLANGFAYMVSNEKLLEHLNEHTVQQFFSHDPWGIRRDKSP